MKSLLSQRLFMTLICLCSFTSITAQNTIDTRLMHDPAISADHIAFIYAEDLWVANRDGSNPIRLTVDNGIERDPVFSPDGKHIAFSAQYDGNTDVFIVSANGGIPKRLTWHPNWDLVRDFSPDGKKVLFASQRTTFTNRYTKLYTVDIASGVVTELPVPNAWWASYSPDGKHIAYTTIPDRYTQWKHYRGGTTSRIWIYNTTDHSVKEIQKPAGGSNDSQPMWVKDRVYFKSDRDGEFNLYSSDSNGGQVTKHSNFTDFSIMNLGSNASHIIYEQAGYLHVFDPAANQSNRLKLAIAADLLELRERFVSGSQYMRSGSISPSGSRAVADFRGDIVTVPAKKGDPKNLTQTTGTHEKNPSWSPDGKSIAYFSDESGEYALHIKTLSSNNVKKVKLDGAGFYTGIHWSPDSKLLTYSDNARNFYVMTVANGKSKIIATDYFYIPGAFRDLHGSWSHDSKFISYIKITDTNFKVAYIYDVAKNKSHAVSDGMSNITDAVFDASGKYLYMISSTDAGPLVNWFDQSNQDMSLSRSIFLVTLQKNTTSPLFKESDEETQTAKKKDKKAKDVQIDWDGIEKRIIDLPIKKGIHYNLSSVSEGVLHYINYPPNASSSVLRKYDLNKRKDSEVMKADWYTISANGKKVLYRVKQNFGITDLGKKGKGFLNIASIKVKINPKKEFPNIFNEAWRVNRDYFYDPKMHGADWPAMKKKYEPFIADAPTRGDLYRMMQWMFSELAVGHHRFNRRGDRMNRPTTISGGLLGADYEVKNNRYVFKKIYGGLNWTPNLKSPLTEPGVNVNAGDYLLAVNGKSVTANQNLFQFFENTSGKITELTIGQASNMKKTRTVNVVPISNEAWIRHLDWVEGNMKKVHEATNGQVAYVYVPNTAGAGHTYFKRYFFPQVNKKAIIVDERFNGGGQLSDYYVDMLSKKRVSNWNFRYGADLRAPSASIQGPKVLIVDETAGSGGDYFPFLWRKYKLGTIVGKKTWGGLVGVLGFPEFIDGGIVSAPNVGFYDENGFGIENVGVAPDIDVEQWPKDVIMGKDPQLEKAIEIILKQLKENPPTEVKRPPHPIRVKKN